MRSSRTPAPNFHAIQYLLGRQTRGKLEVSRLQGRAILSVAHQGYRRRRFFHRLGRLGRGADVVLVAGAGLCPRPWLGAMEDRPEGRMIALLRRRRARRRQHLRVHPRRLEAGPAQLLVDRRLQPPKPRRRGARRSVGALRKTCSAISAGTWSSSNTARSSRRRLPSPVATCCGEWIDLPEPALFRAGVSGRRGVAQASQ